MRPLLLLAAAALPAVWASPGYAQDHGAHHAHPMPAEEVDHAAMGHGAAHATASGPVEASGTARLPQAEGMMPGLHFDLGSGWSGMGTGLRSSMSRLRCAPRTRASTFTPSETSQVSTSGDMRGTGSSRSGR